VILQGPQPSLKTGSQASDGSHRVKIPNDRRRNQKPKAESCQPQAPTRKPHLKGALPEMFLIDTNRNGQVVTDAIVNQSIDNYLVNDLKLPGHGLMMYVNQPAVIVGINQTVGAEVDFHYLEQNHVQLVRRTSGGGAVYHDERNLIFEHIINGDPQDGSKFGDYTVFAEPVLRALKAMGVADLGISNKSALTVDGKKFSGMTRSIYLENMQHMSFYSLEKSPGFSVNDHVSSL